MDDDDEDMIPMCRPCLAGDTKILLSDRLNILINVDFKKSNITNMEAILKIDFKLFPEPLAHQAEILCIASGLWVGPY